MYKFLFQLIPQVYAIPLPSDISGVPQITEASNFFLFIIRTLQSIAGSVAILYIVIAGYFYITARGDDGTIKKAKDSLTFAVVGLMVIALGESIGAVFDPARGINIGGANLIIISITNFLLALIGSVAVIYLVYGGYMYMTARGDSGQVSKATKAIWSSIIGILVAIFAYTIVSVAVTGGESTESPQTGAGINVGVGVGIGL
ncbi:MAG: hypothetical protein HY817_00990 [Candidatus Abawacabacteria bacterium]|nr:hypothetical protein [Candidatus Abawacabacteria bacterium]